MTAQAWPPELKADINTIKTQRERERDEKKEQQIDLDKKRKQCKLQVERRNR